MTDHSTAPQRCWAALDDGRRVMAQCVPETLGGTSGYIVTIDRYDLPVDQAQKWEKGTGGRFQSIRAFLSASSVRFEDPPVGPYRDFGE